MTSVDPRYQGVVEVKRWPTEIPLLVVCIVISLLIYLVLVVSVIGLAYALFIALFLFVAHAALMTHVRGSAVRLGPDQFPELHRRVQELAQRIGLEEVPDAYLMQAGGVLNAFATRFLGAQVIVLYSHLLEACGDNTAARDMIIAHELGHLKAGHLHWRWLVAPAMAIPFLGTALSRAREYTCDRYGMAGAGDRNGAILGLTVLSAGGKLAPGVNRQAFARQREDLNTGWLTIGEWLGTHPPLTRRIAALEPALLAGAPVSHAGWIRALAIIGFLGFGLIGGSVFGWTKFSEYMKEVERTTNLRKQGQSPWTKGLVPDSVVFDTAVTTLPAMK
jgi:Zn-dependent protease with chaperone function